MVHRVTLCLVFNIQFLYPRKRERFVILLWKLVVKATMLMNRNQTMPIITILKLWFKIIMTFLIVFKINFIEITLWHECSPVMLMHIFRTPFPKNTTEGLLLEVQQKFKTFRINCHGHSFSLKAGACLKETVKSYKKIKY